ncbi:uncharacterized protein N7443_001055 [Penicillium atrosanguineum]|uniref:uncharacterized protein n=1 Tax=Penicillium atrosanguineum TaxID=1132637 RepID=UPI0023A511F5|nr:uncharacterized protein N7443_001055 [Penicillium atrosanguineum]KAJ5314171.1 hypothetical protein N7443_001055 [Penicillium atrosanguineum]
MSVTVSLPLPNLLLPSPRGIFNIHTPGLLVDSPVRSLILQSISHRASTTDLTFDRSSTDFPQGKQRGSWRILGKLNQVEVPTNCEPVFDPWKRNLYVARPNQTLDWFHSTTGNATQEFSAC